MLDLIDLNILRQLQNNGRLSNQDLADKVSLSPSACLRRVKTLEQAGYINGYHAVLNAAKLGYTVEAFVQVNIDQSRPSWHDDFIQSIAQLDEIADAYVITGNANYILHIRTKNFEHFSDFIVQTLSRIAGVRDIQSNMVLMSLKSKGKLLPLTDLK